MGVWIFATSLWAIWQHPVNPKVCTPISCPRRVCGALGTTVRHSETSSASAHRWLWIQALMPSLRPSGQSCPLSLASAQLQDFPTATAPRPPPPAPPKEVWEREPGCQRFQGGSGFFYYQVQGIQTRLWTVNTPRGLRVIVKVGAKLGTGKHTLKHREWSPLRNNLRRCQWFGYYVTVN